MYGLTKLYTGINPTRLATLIAYSWCCHEMRGAFAEFGVMKGGSLDMLASLHPNRLIYGIDGFKGLPAPGKNDTHAKGDFELSDNDIHILFDHFHFHHPNVKLLRGYSPDVFKKIPDDQVFSFVHVDVDLFDSVNDAFDFFYPRLTAGGIMIFDDYGFDTTPGAKKAIDQWRGICSYRATVNYPPIGETGQYIIVK